MPLVPVKKQKTPACIREIQVHKNWTKVYSRQWLTAMISTSLLLLLFQCFICLFNNHHHSFSSSVSVFHQFIQMIITTLPLLQLQCFISLLRWSPLPLSSGHYCPNGTEYSTQWRCPAGTYNPIEGGTSSTDCLSCPPGQYCAGQANSAPTGNCSAGWYCSGGADSPNDTVHGGECQAGYYCPEGTAGSLWDDCITRKCLRGLGGGGGDWWCGYDWILMLI